MSRREPSASRSSSSSRAGKGAAGGRAPKVRTDGKVDVNCPQCGTQYRIAADNLDAKIECQECHRVFFGKTAVGKRAKTQDNSKTYMIFGGVALALIVGFLVINSNNQNQVSKPKPQVETKADPYSPSNHPRTAQLVKWAQAIGTDNSLVLQTHSDLAAITTTLGMPAGSDANAVLTELQTNEATKYLRELVCESARLVDEASMEAPTGKGLVFVTPKPGTDDYIKNTRGEIEVAFRTEGQQIKVTGWTVTMKPNRNNKKPDPNNKALPPSKDIAKPAEAEITDSAGTRKVAESKPAAVPHWDKATPEQQAKADQIVADILRSASADAPRGLFARTLLAIDTLEAKKAAVPRVLNAMFELYADVNANNEQLTLLDRAMRDITGFSVNYESKGTNDAAKDKALRESSVRQWFAFWYRYANGELDQFIDTRENLDEPEPDPKAKKKQ